MQQRPFRWFLIGLLAWLVGSLDPGSRGAFAMHPTHPLGFDPERAFQDLSGIDGVDLFSGSLSLGVPVGPFNLIYSSNVWRYDVVVVDGADTLRATPDRRTTAGFGWHLGWGEVFHPDHWTNASGKWLYRGPDGARHTFYPTLHVGEDDGDDLVFYSRDGSYLRLRTTADRCRIDIEHPDGSTRRFENGTCGPNAEYTLRKVWSPFASAEDPDQTITYNADDTLRTVQDRYGRTQRIHLTDNLGGQPIHWFDRLITRIEIDAFGEQTLAYELEYIQVLTSVSCKDTYHPPGHRTAIPHLKAIHNLADGTSFRMHADGELLYHNLCTVDGERLDDIPGVLRGLELPTGGKVRWTFQEYEFPPGNNNSVFATTAGVATRTLLEADGSEHGTWRYRTTKNNNGCFDNPEVYTEVAYPTGECTKHYFNGRYCLDQSNWLGWEFGLPFVYSQEHGGRFLSSQVFAAFDPNSGACTGQPLRSTYLRFRHDAPQGDNPGDWYNTNRQVKATRTVYHDDPDDSGNPRWIDTASSDFDGLGHFRRTVTTGNLWEASETFERRESFTAYDRAQGTYFTPEYQPPLPDDPWILGTFAHIEITESEAAGETMARIEYGFEPGTGFLYCTRTLASGAARQAKDLLQVFERDALGLTTDIKRYGGDRDPLSVNGEGCGDVPAEPVYWTRHTYQHGVLATRQPLYPNGAAGPFLTYDADIDRATGLPTVQRDPAGFGTTFSFDALGRVTAIVPDEGAVTYVDYFPAGSGQPARAAASAVPAAGGATLSEYEIELDAYGRSRVERATLPGNAWTERITERNARGWATAVSQWGDTTRRTEFLDFDAFGRAHTIRPPDGAAHDVKLFYLGDRQITTETKIALDDGEAYVARINESDSYGRLRRVEEGSGEGGAMAATTYAYDVASRLTRIQSGEQNRLYLFDNRGFLLSEQHPEVGAGNGSVSYRSFDAAGLAHRMTDAARDLSYTYDFMGRPTKVRDLSKGKRLISSWEYDLGAGFGLGKVYRANHVNYLDAPWNNPGEEPLSVRHTYRYEGLGGALDSRDTHFFWSLPTVAFRSEYRYDELGNLDQLSYPRCISGNCLGTPAAAGPVVEAQYDQGLLTAIPGWADNISYDPSGAWAEVQRCNGVADHRVPDPDIAARPLRLFTTGVAPAVANFDSGPMAYDGAGNLTTTGADTYRYDEAERLTEASYADGSLQQLYGYDVYGNLAWRSTGGSTESFAIDPATNRLADGSYDAAGNLLHWGGQHFAYDVNNRLTRQAHMGYFYDADGERVGSYVNVPAFGPSLSLHLRDPAGRLLSRFSLVSDTWGRDRDYVYADSRLFASTATHATGSDERHYHLDHLGSPRLVTDGDGVALNVLQFLPYGEDLLDSLSADDPMGFTGHERDLSTGTDYMHARHYLSDVGRFLSVDPVRGVLSSPQSFNRYAYVQGNPINFNDPTGERPREFQDHATPTTTFYDSITVVAYINGSGDLTIVSRGGNGSGRFYDPRAGRGGGRPSDGWITSVPGPTPETENPNPQETADPDGPITDEDGEIDCSKQASPVACEVGKGGNSEELREKNCFFASFIGVSVAGGAVGAWGLYGGATGLLEGATAKTIGYQSLVSNLGGMGHLGNFTWGGTQGGFLISMLIRGSYGNGPVQLPGGPITRLEGIVNGIGRAGGPMIRIGIRKAGNAASNAVNALWKKSPCG